MTPLLLLAALASPTPAPTPAELQRNLSALMHRTPGEEQAYREMWAHGAKLRGERP